MQQSEVTMKELFQLMGYPHEAMPVNEPIDVTSLGYEVMSQHKDGKSCWQLIKSIIKKEETQSYNVADFDLTVSPMHLFWAKVSNSEPHWVEAVGLTDCDDVELFHQTLGWVKTSVTHSTKQTEILDIEVENTACYYTNGLLSHNTLHGDPKTTPGGKAIPFAASVRVRLSSGAQVKDKNGNLIGSHVIATIKKNKVAAPWRKVEFDIIFGKGIVEDEYLFDEVRSWCDNGGLKRDGKVLSITGTGGWKELLVIDEATGDVLLTKKFTKSQFGEVRKNPDYAPYVDALIDAALTHEHGGQPETDEEPEE